MMFCVRPSCVPRVPPKRLRAPFEKWAVVLAITLSTPAGVTALAQTSIPASPLVCDLTAYAPIGGITAHVLGDVLLVQWPGAEDERLRLGLSIVNGTPIIDELAIRDESQTWVTIATDAKIEFKITEGLRRISNQQLSPLRNLGVELTQDVVDTYKWDVFWDAPLDLRSEVGGGNPPPAAGVAEQPGLPRSPDEVRRADAVYYTEGCVVTADGARLEVTFPGMQLGSFSGDLVLTVYEGTNLIRVEAVASTDLPSVAYKYDLGLTGLDLEDSRIAWRDIANERHSYSLLGPANSDHVVLRAANRLVVAETNGGAIAAVAAHHLITRKLASGSIDTRLSDFEVLRAAGITIAGPVDRPRDATQLEELHWLFEGALRHSDDAFMVMPQMENTNLLGGHWDLLFSHPVYYVDERAPETPLVTEHPEYGRMYNIGTAQDLMTMIEAEDMLVFMPHPRTKGSTGFPDAVADTPHFLSDRYRGAGWRWGMGSDLSEVRLSDYRVIPLLDYMNNWIADTSLRPKYLLAITETYAKAPGDDIYATTR